MKEGRGASLGGLSAIAYTLLEKIERNGESDLPQLRAGHAAAPDGSFRRSSTAERPLVMGIVNVTPDSFSDGGLNADAARAIAHGLQLAAEGADILDVGRRIDKARLRGRSRRRRTPPRDPGDRGAGSSAGHAVSVDTRKASVMRAALKAGASMVNDVAALAMIRRRMEAMAEASCPVVLMHAQGDPKTMQLSPHYEDVALDVYDWLDARIEACVAAGIARERIIADPGIGFGKSFRHNIDLLRPVHAVSRPWRSASDGAFAQGFHRRAHGRKTGGEPRAWFGGRCHMVGPERSAHSSRS